MLSRATLARTIRRTRGHLTTAGQNARWRRTHCRCASAAPIQSLLTRRRRGAQTARLAPLMAPLVIPAGPVAPGPPADALVTVGGDDGTRTHDPLLAKQVL
jgi:hypothetical protein